MKQLADYLHLTGLFPRGHLTHEEMLNLETYYRHYSPPRPAIFTASLGGHTHR
ncbi:hypothetical protein [Rhodococcus opacus]|uniref:hypothetical protein n=1 Tax=Rhodococcus opacus TaxID=37919 RepID=UPI0029536FD2|nr:hypothetical protein [Rhodococcus opacus]MDV7086019.1 hypothetical protein [Rhodococcus opacus]